MPAIGAAGTVDRGRGLVLRAAAAAAAGPPSMSPGAATAALFSSSPRVMPSFSGSVLDLAISSPFVSSGMRHGGGEAPEDADGVARERGGVEEPAIGADSDRADSEQASSGCAARCEARDHAACAARLLDQGARFAAAVQHVE